MFRQACLESCRKLSPNSGGILEIDLNAVFSVFRNAGYRMHASRYKNRLAVYQSALNRLLKLRRDAFFHRFSRPYGVVG